MQQGCCSTYGASHRIDRNGFLYLGSLRELTLISVALVLTLVVLGETGSILRLLASGQDLNDLNERANPVLSLDLDDDHQSLLVHSWPEYFEEIKLVDDSVLERKVPEGLVSVATSEKNSTSVMLTKWGCGDQIHHGVYVIRRGDFVMSEEIEFANSSMANAYISEDGSVAMLITYDGACIGWDLTACEPIRWEFQLAQSAFTKCLSPDGRSLFVVSNDGNSSICDARTGEVKTSLPKVIGCSRSVSWSSDGRHLAIGDLNGGLFVFETSSGKQLWYDKLNYLFARSLSFSRDGNLLAVGLFDKQIRLWDISHPTDHPKILAGNASVVTDIVFTARDATLITGCLDGTITEWSLASHQKIRQIR